MQNPFNKKAVPENRLSLADVQDISVVVNVKIIEIKKNPDAVERMKQLTILQEEMHKIYNDGAPQVTDKKSFLTGLGLGSIAAGAVTLTAVSAGAIFVPWMTLPAAAVWVATHVGVSTAAGAGLGGLWGNQKERKRLSQKYGSVEVAEALHKIVSTVDAEVSRETYSTTAFDKRLSDAFKPAVEPKANDNKPAEKKDAPPAPKREMGDYKHLKKGPYGQ
ncbi:MAG: hypothetical protein KGQ70_09625 [Alphaproteobacteria bacterium]|nr:hypothetical protein [Alphaproteobacteria bacterium]